MNRDIEQIGTMKSSGLIEVDLFSTDVNELDHPEVINLRELLEDVAQEYHCRLLFFDVHQGTVTFSFDSDTLMAEILKILRNDFQSKP